MRKKYLFISVLICFLLTTKPAVALKDLKKEQLIQQIEILQQEIFILKSLIKASKSQKITAQAYLVFDVSKNKILLKKNHNKVYPIASITKLMTATIAKENINPKNKITINSEILKDLKESLVFFNGANLEAEDLIKANLIQSSNQAAKALTYFLGEEKFLTLMNQKAKGLGMKNTIFYDSSGLSPLNRSTAEDIVKILIYIYKNHPDILKTTKENNFWLKDQNGKWTKFMNLNDFYLFNNFIGGKTGYIPESKQTFASLFNIKGRIIAIAILYSDNTKADTFLIIKEINKLL